MEFCSNGSSNKTLTIYGDNAAPALASLSILVSSGTVLSNLFVLIYFIKHQNIITNESNFAFQVLTLIINDIIAGISTIPLFVTPFEAQEKFELCAVRVVVFLSTQIVVLYHILGICVYRLVIVFQATRPLRTTNQRKLLIIYQFITWVVTLIIFTLPFFIWTDKYRRTLNICSLNELFQNSYKVVIIYYISFYIPPFILTNVVYVAMILKLRYTARSVIPSHCATELDKKEIVNQFIEHSDSEKVELCTKRLSPVHEDPFILESTHLTQQLTTVSTNPFTFSKCEQVIQRTKSVESTAEYPYMSNIEPSKDWWDEDKDGNKKAETTEMTNDEHVPHHSKTARLSMFDIKRSFHTDTKTEKEVESADSSETKDNDRRTSLNTATFRNQKKALTTIGMFITYVFTIYILLSATIKSIKIGKVTYKGEDRRRVL